ncbi:MAG: hypothetical protein U1F36_03980 [Planctomycetota bacterium]
MATLLVEPTSPLTSLGAQPIPSTNPSQRTTTRIPHKEPAVVLAPLKNRMVLVETADRSRVAVHAAGTMRVLLVRLVAGDAVVIERSTFDPTKGRIVALDSAFPEHQRRAPNPRRIPDSD